MGQSFEEFVKFPRTPHIFESKGTDDDKKMGLNSSLELISQSGLIIEEKIDGSNSAIQFSKEGFLILQNRGQYWFEKESDKSWEKGLTHPQYDLFKNWALNFKERMFKIIGDRYIVYGEWMYAKHHIFYDLLPHYFIEFDVYDKDSKIFLDTESRLELLKGSGIISIKVISGGPVKNFKKLESLIVKSFYTNDIAEGVYLKNEENGYVVARAKYVRKDFTQEIIDLNRHWADVKMVVNQLKPGVNIFE